MSTVPGLPKIRTINLPLVGRASIIAELWDSASAAFLITNAYSVTAEFMLNPDSAVSLTKTSGAGEITVLNTAGNIYIPLSAADLLLFKGVGKVLTMRVKLIYVSDGVTIKLVNQFYVIPLNQLFVWSQPTEVAMALSTTFYNTAVSALGEAYLDTVLCVNQPVGCSLKISIDANTPPQTWILRASTDASVAGQKRRAVDYAAATNEKVWFKEI